MGVAASKLRARGGPPRAFVPGEFVVAWLTFKGDAVEDRDHRVVARKDGILSSKLLRTLFGDETMACFDEVEGEYIPREMFVCMLVLIYEGNTEDRISYLFTMYCIMYGLERESDGCILRDDYICLLEHLETVGVVPKKFYAAFEECAIEENALMLIDQFLDWVRRYPALLEFLTQQLPPVIGQTSPISARLRDENFNSMDALNHSPSCRLDKDKSYGSFDFIGGEDSGDDSDDAYDSDQIMYALDDGFDDDMVIPAPRDNDERAASDASDKASSAPLVASTTPTTVGPLSSPGAAPVRRRGGRGGLHPRNVQRMSKNLSRRLGGGISKVGRTILHGNRAHNVGEAQLDTTPATLLNAGYAFSSESQVSKSFVCGYLHKLGDGKWSKRAWHRRWFVLDRKQGIISYYRHNPANLITASSRGNIVHMDHEGTDASVTAAKLLRAKSLDEAGAGVNGSSPDESERSSVGAVSNVSISSNGFNSTPSSTNTTASTDKSASGQNMLYLNKNHPWFRGELNLNQDNVSLLFEKAFARNAPTRYYFQVSTLSLQDIDSKRGMQYKLCAENAEDFDNWTQAISEVINRKLEKELTAHPTPALTQQQVYRQRLLKEEQQRKERDSIVSPVAVSAAPSATFAAQLDPLRHESTHNQEVRSSIPPRVVTQFSGERPSPWILQLRIEGGRQALIMGIFLNMVAFRCLTPQHIVMKALLCAAVTGAFVMCAYRPNRPPPPCHPIASPVVNTRSSSVCTSAHPEHCCLHKPAPVVLTRDTSGSIVSHVKSTFKKYPLGFSMAKTEWVASGHMSKVGHAWAPTRAESFVVRSLGYAQTKRKEPSAASLFEFLGADAFITECKTDLLAQRVQLPKEYEGATLFVLNFQLPSYAPSVWGDARSDGPGYALVMYWKIPEEVCEELKAPRSKVVKLLKRFLEAGDDISMTDRFKLIVQVTNVDECGVTGVAKKLMSSHNATPVLTRPQHRIFRLEDGSTEVVIDVHSFCYIARRGLHMLLDKANRLVFDAAFVIQGETDDELPERILGCGRFNALDARKGKHLP